MTKTVLPTPVEELSAGEARRAALRAQGFRTPPAEAGGPDSVLRRVSAVQLDTISVLARSHELVGYSRLGPVPRKDVEAAYWGRPAPAFEYYGHANCVFPAEMWPYFAFRRRLGNGREVSGSLAAAITEIRARLQDGPVTATDLGGARSSAGWWNWSDAKRAIEGMYWRGEVVCSDRKAWKRVYDLPERALPLEVLAHEPSDEECFEYLVGRAGRALGVGTAGDIAEYFRLTRAWAGSPGDARRLLARAIEASAFIPVRVEGWKDPAYADPAALEPSPGEVDRTTLLSPFGLAGVGAEADGAALRVFVAAGGVQAEGAADPRLLHNAVADRRASCRQGGPGARERHARRSAGHAGGSRGD